MPNFSSIKDGWWGVRAKPKEVTTMDMPLPEAIKKKVVYRDAVTGKFCTKAYAEAHPATTVKETL